MPELAILLDGVRLDGGSHERLGSLFPKAACRLVRRHYTDLQLSREFPPYFVRDLGANSTPSKCPQDKELSHIPHRLVTRDLRALFDKHKSCNFTVDLEKEGMAVCLTPIE